jgi:CNT family concentrative nucleoside transporter
VRHWEYLLAATVMKAPAGLLIANIIWPDSTPAAADEPHPSSAETGESDPSDETDATVSERPAREIDVRSVHDTESANAIDAVARGALAGGRIAVTVGALLIAFVAFIAMANGSSAASGTGSATTT